MITQSAGPLSSIGAPGRRSARHIRVDERVHWDVGYHHGIPGASLTFPVLLYGSRRGCATSPALAACGRATRGSEGDQMMKTDHRTIALAACAAVIVAAPIAYAQV